MSGQSTFGGAGILSLESIDNSSVTLDNVGQIGDAIENEIKDAQVQSIELFERALQKDIACCIIDRFVESLI